MVINNVVFIIMNNTLTVLKINVVEQIMYSNNGTVAINN